MSAARATVKFWAPYPPLSAPRRRCGFGSHNQIFKRCMHRGALQMSGDDIPVSARDKFFAVKIGETEFVRYQMLPALDDFPIPAEVDVGGLGWSPGMVEMADHIGGRATLLLGERLGGQDIPIPVDPRNSLFNDILGAKKAAILCWAYRAQVLPIPTMKNARAAARRKSVVAHVRKGHLPVSAAALIAGTSRTYMSHLVHHTDEGKNFDPGPLPLPREKRMRNDLAEIAEDVLSRAGVPDELIARIKSEIDEL